MGQAAEGSEFESQYVQGFSHDYIIQTSSGAHADSYPVGFLPSEVKWPGHEADHSPPSSAKVKKL
jgi:hypothetical protein